MTNTRTYDIPIAGLLRNRRPRPMINQSIDKESFIRTSLITGEVLNLFNKYISKLFSTYTCLSEKILTR